MASIASMIGGAVLNAAAFIGGNYLAKAIGGTSDDEILAEKKCHKEAFKVYQTAYGK